MKSTQYQKLNKDVLLEWTYDDNNFIQEPYNIQNLNRYSYGLNNPFKYNDPSGYFFKILIKWIMMINNSKFKNLN